MTTETHPPTCPVAHGQAFNPLDPGQSGDPYPWLRAAQAKCPVFYMPEQNMWCVTRYADVVQVLRDTETYSSRKVIRLAQLDADLLDAFPDGPPDEVLVSTDPPKHTRLRALAQTAFTPKLVNEREDEIRALCHRLIDGFADRGRCDLAAEFAERLPVQAITRLVGAPLEKSEDFYQWGIDRVTLLLGAPRLDERQRAELSRRVVAMSTWLREFVEERRENPRDDLASALVHATTDEGFPVLSTPETVTMIGTILSAGSSTTSHFLPLMVRELLSHPDQWAQVAADRGVLKRAVEEVLRYRTSVHGVTRTTTRPVTLGGVDLPEGADLYVHYAAAQRDPEIFDDPDALDVHRPNVKRHFAFGRGVHTCLGAPLARLEARVALECLIDRLPNLRLAPDAPPERWIPSMLTPGLERLDLEWDPIRA
ncbi:cytochrome P450 [Actinomadura welshii]|uniref:cytochrome P450 n=1 Tax=Actinomadura welshii TaxID=3103817 RepID=UPI0004677D8D|nr:cytochrome P450 [Actinomadura madurae]